VAQNIDDYEKLKMSVHKEFKAYFLKGAGPRNMVEDSEIRNETKNQVNYLKSAVKLLRQRLEKERLAHKMDKQDVMNHN